MLYLSVHTCQGFPGGSMVKKKKKSTCQCRRPGFDPWLRKILWRRKWQPAPIFLPGKFHGREGRQAEVHRVAKSQTGLSAHANTHTQTHTHTHTHICQVRMKLQNWTAVCIKVTLIPTPLPSPKLDADEVSWDSPSIVPLGLFFIFNHRKVST